MLADTGMRPFCGTKPISGAMSDDEDDDSAAEAAAAAVVPPRANPDLVGHGEAEAALLYELLSLGRLPHAWLFTGPRGVGRRRSPSASHAFFLRKTRARARACSRHPREPRRGGGSSRLPPRRLRRARDLLLVARAYDPKRRRRRSDIVVDDTRAISGFLRLTPAEGGWRVVIVDGADAINRNAPMPS